MDVPAPKASGLIGTTLSISVAIFGCLPNAYAHDLFEQWGSDVTPILCAMASESGWEYDEKYDTNDHGPVNIRVYIGSFHPGVESTLDYLEDLDPDPFFIKLQVITSLRKRVDDVSVTLSDSSSYDVQITTRGFQIARAMMAACVQSVKEFPLD